MAKARSNLNSAKSRKTRSKNSPASAIAQKISAFVEQTKQAALKKASVLKKYVKQDAAKPAKGSSSKRAAAKGGKKSSGKKTLAARAMMFVGASVALLVAVSAMAADVEELADVYSKRYGLKDAVQVKTDGKGNGDERLYGTRNFRVVLNGVLYRGGGNNHKHRVNPRNNTNPLQDDALENLCKEGFTSVFYTYKTGWEKARTNVTCDSFRDSSNRLDYASVDPLKGDGLYPILKAVHKTIESPKSNGPVYVHCWNGWHASGFVSAVALIQFCGIDNETAVAYWTRTQDSDPAKYAGVIKRIRAFQPYQDL
ncbi:MAG TPA: hypothetical protein VFV50_19180, partial [Bdellovibrionales bacterium]|nr:hypothetical protein [Bdellovibrionales bacterium]